MSILNKNLTPKRNFNPKSAIDLKEYKKFKQTYSWRNPCPFVLEWPYTNVPGMIQDKIIDAHINSIINIK